MKRLTRLWNKCLQVSSWIVWTLYCSIVWSLPHSYKQTGTKSVNIVETWNHRYPSLRFKWVLLFFPMFISLSFVVAFIVVVVFSILFVCSLHLEHHRRCYYCCHCTFVSLKLCLLTAKTDHRRLNLFVVEAYYFTIHLACMYLRLFGLFFLEGFSKCKSEISFLNWEYYQREGACILSVVFYRCVMLFLLLWFFFLWNSVSAFIAMYFVFIILSFIIYLYDIHRNNSLAACLACTLSQNCYHTIFKQNRL